MQHVERYLAPIRLPQALAVLGLPGGATVLAGGTDLMPQSHAGKVRPAPMLLNIRRVEGLDGIGVDGEALNIGALVTVTQAMRSELVQRHAPLLVQVGNKFASEQIRNAATFGGNLCNASPAGDLLAPLLALDAEAELARLANDGAILKRRLALADFFTGPGRTSRAADELLTAVRVPLAAPGQVARFYKGGTRLGLDISSISIAFVATRGAGGSLEHVRLSLGAVAPTPMRARRAEALLEGAAPDAPLIAAASVAAAAEARPIDDVRASAWYRRELLVNMVKRMLEDVVAR
jgi:CO/xanthine dehydrogenase FAD-binding subunit